MSDESGRPRVLLVEDDALIAEVLQLALQEAGYDVDHRGDGKSAVAAVTAETPVYAALVTDVRLPGGVNGWGVARLARQTRAALPVIYMSGDSAGDWDAEGVPHSVMLQKPFAPSQLVVALAAALNRSDGP